MKTTVSIVTLGCKTNQFESAAMIEQLQAAGYQKVDFTAGAELVIVNTCTVTAATDSQSRNLIRRARRINPQARVVVTGCYAQIDPQACADIVGVDLVLGNDLKLDVHKLLPKLERGELDKIVVGDLDKHVGLPENLLTGFDEQTRAFVQIQQGCDQGCTFCIIHVARGPSRSLVPSLIKRQVQRLVINGYPEIVICGVDLGSYGEDFQISDSEQSQKMDLVTLLESLLSLEYQADNPFRIRLSSIDPSHITDQLIELIANEKRICSHIHLSLQSGNTLILKRMKRRYDADFVRERIAALRNKVPDLVISSDVMVGFPTETDEQFQDTKQMLIDLQIIYPHVFSYSAREGTPAARIPQDKQVPKIIRKQRNKELRQTGQQLRTDLLNKVINQRAWVLPENPAKKDGYMLCKAENYLPVLVPNKGLVQGRWCYVEYVSCKNDFLHAQLIKI